MKKILVYFQQVGGANALLPLFNKWRLESEITITGRSLICENLRQRNIAAVDPIDMGWDKGNKDPSADWFDKIDPDIVITDTINLSRIPEQENCCDLWELAGQKGVPSIGYVDSWGAYKERFKTSADTGMPVLPDMIAVINDTMKNSMLSAGFPESRLAVLGSPRLDALYNQGATGNNGNKIQLYRDLGIEADSFVITFVSEPIEKYHYPDAYEKWGFTEKTILASTIDILKEFPDEIRAHILLAILIHPEEDEHELRTLVNSKGPDFNVAFHKGEQTLEMISAADLVIGMLSMLLVEAVVLQRPVISLQMGLKQKDYLVTNLVGATAAVRRQEELFEVLLKAVSDGPYRESLLSRQKKFQVSADAPARWEKAIDELLAT